MSRLSHQYLLKRRRNKIDLLLIVKLCALIEIMKEFFNLYLISITFLVFSQQISALFAIPTEDLLGPEVCPTGSYCTERDLCTSYYTTKLGHPFFCGPHQKIDSKVCCIESESAPNNGAQDLNEVILNIPDRDDHHRSLNLTDEIDEDDEVDILSLPYTSNQIDDIPYDSESILSDSDAGLDRSLGDLETLLEDAIEQEYNSAHTPPSPNVRETGFKSVDAHQSNQQDFDNLNRFNGPIQDIHSVHRSQPEPGPSVKMEDQQNINVESRTPHNYENQKQRSFACPCEKGEKGDPGPKGEPGEPGKIIYIPVFVNNGQPTTPETNYGGTPPLQFGSSQQNMLVHRRNTRNQPGQAQVPHHPNPTVVPFNVPVNIPSNNPSGVGGPTPQQQHSYPSPYTPQPAHYNQVPVSSQTPPPTNSIPYNDGMQARPSRNTQVNDQRFTNRRY